MDRRFIIEHTRITSGRGACGVWRVARGANRKDSRRNGKMSEWDVVLARSYDPLIGALMTVRHYRELEVWKLGMRLAHLA